MAQRVPGKAEQASSEGRRLAEAIEHRREDIANRWLARVRAEVARGKVVDEVELRDSIDDYLGRVADSLRAGGASDAHGRKIWDDVAEAHAYNRVRLGFDIDQLLRELLLLRRVLNDMAREEGVNDSHASDRLTEYVEAAMSASVSSYARVRDEASRKAQVEHVSFLTHELRNPLSAATLAAAQLRRGLPLAGRQARVLDLLDSSHERLRRLIDDVLTTERFEAGKVAVRPAEITLDELLHDAVTVGQQGASAKGLEFRAEFDPTVRLQADRSLTSSAVQNLVDNAVKFTDRGKVELQVETRPGELVVRVRDSCGGVPAEELRRLFEPFERGQSRHAGSGLGLAIARRAVESQGGEMHAESSSAGCHFWFRLPMKVHAKG